MKIENTQLVSPLLQCILMLRISSQKFFNTCEPLMRHMSKARMKSLGMEIDLQQIQQYQTVERNRMNIKETQKSNERNQDIMNLVKDKEAMIQQLLQRIGRQEKTLMSKFEQQSTNAKQIKFQVYQQFLCKNKQGEGYSLLIGISEQTVLKQQSIWFSNQVSFLPFPQQPISTPNIVTRNVGIQFSSQSIQSKKLQLQVLPQAQTADLTNNVQKMKKNLQRYSQMISNLKQLKQLQLLQRQQGQEIYQLNRLKKDKQQLQNLVDTLRSQLASKIKENDQLNHEIYCMSQQKHKSLGIQPQTTKSLVYSPDDSRVDSDRPKKKGKVYLIGY